MFYACTLLNIIVLIELLQNLQTFTKGAIREIDKICNVTFFDESNYAFSILEIPYWCDPSVY